MKFNKALIFSVFFSFTLAAFFNSQPSLAMDRDEWGTKEGWSIRKVLKSAYETLILATDSIDEIHGETETRPLNTSPAVVIQSGQKKLDLLHNLK